MSARPIIAGHLYLVTDGTHTARVWARNGFDAIARYVREAYLTTEE